MTFAINGFHFDASSGVVLTPQRDARVYTTPASPHFGLQVLAPRGPQFQIQLTRFTNAAALDTLQRFLTSHIGQLVTIVDGPIQYIFSPWQLRFAVVGVQILESRLIPSAMTTRAGTHIEYTPAAVVKSQWTMHAIPAG